VRTRKKDGMLELAMANWWFVPASFQGTYAQFQRKLTTFNARNDSIAKSSTFRQAFGSRRCLVPASGWYEWTTPPDWKKGHKKTKWVFHEGRSRAGVLRKDLEPLRKHPRGMPTASNM
jgi:putative SOS response-associated peptidase YedK